MAERKFYWLKLKDDFFQQKEIKKLRKIAGGDTYTIIYLKMQLLSLKNEGILKYERTESNLSEQISLEIDEDEDNVQVTLQFLQSNNLIEMLDEETYLLTKASENIGKEGSSAERMRRLREKQKAKKMLTSHCDSDVQNCYTEQEQEQEIEQEIEQQQDIDKILKNYYSDRDIKIIKKYCADNNVAAAVVKEKLFVLLHKKNIKNKVGSLIAAIKDDWQLPKELENIDPMHFNNFKARDYDYEDLENKLLGWDKDDE